MMGPLYDTHIVFEMLYKAAPRDAVHLMLREMGLLLTATRLKWPWDSRCLATNLLLSRASDVLAPICDQLRSTEEPGLWSKDDTRLRVLQAEHYVWSAHAAMGPETAPLLRLSTYQREVWKEALRFFSLEQLVEAKRRSSWGES